ncbi:unnamed protein product [Merluccius merluccius]
MMQTMGWNPGTGLGPEGRGITEPIRGHAETQGARAWASTETQASPGLNPVIQLTGFMVIERKPITAWSS